MKTYRIIFLFALIFSCWNCANPELEIEEEAFLNAELNLLADNLTVQDFLRDDSPEEFKQATGRILVNAFGKNVLQRIKRNYPDGLGIYFYPILDRDGNLLVGDTGEFRYYGAGKIDYNYNILHDPNNDELLFHEFFHFFQNENLAPNKSLNNEVEAYLAQYFYAIYKRNGPPEVIDPFFTKILKYLAEHIDINTGYFLSGTDRDAYHRNYQMALDYLRSLPAYNDEGYYWNELDKNQPYPNLVKLLKS